MGKLEIVGLSLTGLVFTLLLVASIRKWRAGHPKEEKAKKEKGKEDKKKEKESKPKKHSIGKSFALGALGWIVVSVITLAFLNWLGGVDSRRMAERAKAKSAAKYQQAARLRYSMVIPDRERDVSLVVHAGQYNSRWYKIREGYCVPHTEPVNQGETYVFGTQRGEFLVSPADEELVPTGPVEYFYARAYGGPTVDVRVWVIKKTPNGECKDPTRNS